jgi:regulation of enolase protein 1 (concanavalin A-like superfamily)
MIYNHYVVLKGLKAPNVTAMAAMYRPEGFVHDDNFGFGTLAYTLDASKSPYPPAAVPPMPRDLSSAAGVGVVWLNWAPSATATGYNVERATSPNGPYTQIASFHGAFPLYADSSVANGVTYYYRVSATNQTGASGASKESAGATPQAIGPLPSDWTRIDIGSCAAPGDASYASVAHDTFIVSGSGSGLGIGSAPDGLSFLSRKVHGDFTFTARRIASDFHGGKHQRIGIVVRESLDPSAKSVAMITGDLGAREARFGARVTDGGAAEWQYGNGYSGGVTWYRLKRSGDTFTGYQSIDGKTWYAVGTPYTIPMAGEIYAGFAISSNGDKISGATFDNVSLTAPGDRP